MLVAELKKIEGRKKEREKKSQDLNKLITAAENKPTSIISADIGSTPILQDLHQVIKLVNHFINFPIVVFSIFDFEFHFQC